MGAERGSEREREKGSADVMRWRKGRKYSALANGKDGYALDYAGGKFVLFAFSGGWTEEKLEQFSPEAETTLRWTDVVGVGVLCAKFGNLPWGFCICRPVDEDLQCQHTMNRRTGEPKGIVLNIVCADSNTGEVLLIRRTELSADFTMALLGNAEREPLSEEEYKGRADVIRRGYSAEQLLQAAELRYTMPGTGKMGEK